MDWTLTEEGTREKNSGWPNLSDRGGTVAVHTSSPPTEDNKETSGTYSDQPVAFKVEDGALVNDAHVHFGFMKNVPPPCVAVYSEMGTLLCFAEVPPNTSWEFENTDKFERGDLRV